MQNKISGASYCLCLFVLWLNIVSCATTPKTAVPGTDYSKQMSESLLCGVPPLIVGHRGAAGHTPEHTMHSYKLALDMGADYIEPDLVMTKDGEMIARHENEISETTDVADKFPKRKKTKVIDGEEKTGWFTEDFTLGEIKSLHARERLPFRSHAEDGKYDIPTFVEILGFVKLEERKRGRKIGIAPEIKHSSYFAGLNLPMEEKIAHLLKKYNLNNSDSKVMIQSFETENLKKLNNLVNVELVQLLDEKQTLPIDFKAIREYAEWVSPHKGFIVQVGSEGQILGTSKFVAEAHGAGLKVLPYTFRSDENFLAKAYLGDAASEYRMFFNMGVDGLFSDFPDQAVAARKSFFAKCAGRP